ncbi:MAG TPA: immunoglobulin domain-containing protein [Opitutaceae bacterium]
MRFGLQLRPLLLLLALVCACPAFGQAPAITGQSAARQAVLAGQSLTLSVTATSATPATYQWRRNGLPIAEATAASYGIASAKWNHSGWYQAVVTNASGSIISRPIHVNVALSPVQIVQGGNYFADWSQSAIPTGLTSVSALVMGSYHALALKHDGTVSAWSRPGRIPAPPSGLNDVVAIAAGPDYSLALRADGSVVAWGSIDELAVPGNLRDVVSIAAGANHILALKADGTVVAWGNNYSRQTEVPANLRDVVAVSAGYEHSTALRSDGTVVTWGQSYAGATHSPAGLNRVVAIASAGRHTVALRANGSVVSWGDDEEAQAGVPNGLEDVVSIDTNWSSTIALKRDGTVVGWGVNTNGELNFPADLNSVVAITMGETASLALRDASGDTAPTISVHPVSQALAVGVDFTLSVTASGSAPLRYQWYRNGTLVPEATKATLVLSSFDHTNAGSYDVVVSNDVGSARSLSADITITQRGPTVLIQPVSATVREGWPVSLKVVAVGTGPVSYQWYRNNAPIAGATRETYAVYLTRTDIGTYHATARDANGTTLSRPATLSMATAPVFTTQPVSIVTGIGKRVSFHVTIPPSPIGRARFQWYKNGVAVDSFGYDATIVATGEQYSEYSFTLIRVSDVGTYHVVATNDVGSTTSAQATLTIPDVPAIMVAPQSATVRQGHPIVLRVVAVSSSIMSYRWRKNGVPIENNPTALTQRLFIYEASVADIGDYDVVITSSDGTTISRPVNIALRLLPAITQQPAAVTALTGQNVTLSVAAQNAETYLWRKNGQPLAGNVSATTATLLLPAVTVSDAGVYDVVITNANGSVTSATARLEVTVPLSRLANVSVLAQLSADETLTVGVVTGGSGTTGDKPLLIRAVGPSLAPLGVADALADPKLEWLRGSAVVGSNDNWGSGQTAALVAAFTEVGAFAYTGTAALDSALHLPTVARGDYTARIAAATPGGAGWVLAEIYDSTRSSDHTSTTPRLINLSVIKRIEGTLTAGFVIAGTRPKVLLIRAIGPGLAGFSVAGFMPDPKIELFDGQRASLATNDNWGGASALATAFSQSGAFALGAGSRDAALLRAIEPGSYTVQVSSADGVGGVGLIEIYEVP